MNKLDFQKIAEKIIKLTPSFPTENGDGRRLKGEHLTSLENDIAKELESAYLEGRKAQVKVDAEIARDMENDFWDDGQYQTTDSGIKIAKAIESQEIK